MSTATATATPAKAAPTTIGADIAKASATAALAPVAAPIFAAKKPPMPPQLGLHQVSSQLLALKLIAPRKQPRKHFDEAALKELADSIKAQDLIQPIVVRALAKPDKNGCTYELVAGERRMRAHQLLGRGDIRAEVRDLTETQVRFAQLAENVQREQLTLTEQCDAMKDLVDEVGLEEATRVMGKSAGWVSKRATAHKLPAEVKKLVTSGKLLDIEIAAGLGELKDLGDTVEGERIHNPYSSLLKDIEHPEAAWNGAVTREMVRDAIRENKKTKAEILKDQAEKKLAAESAKTAKPGTPGAKGGEGGEFPTRKVSEAERHAGRVAADRKNLKDKAYAALNEGLQLGKGDRFDDPIALDYIESASDWSGFPKTSEACHFDFHGGGDIALLKKLASGLPGKVVVNIEPMDLSLDEAQKVSDALKGLPGFKQLVLSFKHRITGGDLRGCVKKLAPAQLDKLPLPRAEREAAKKAKNPSPLKGEGATAKGRAGEGAKPKAKAKALKKKARK